MTTFHISFCDPFRKEVIDCGQKERLEVIPFYNSIPWVQLNEEIYTRHDDVIHDFYFIEVSYTDASGNKHTLNISPEFVTGSQLGLEAMRFTIRHIRPRMRKRFLGLGGEKLDPASMSEWDDNDNRAVTSCLIAFMEGDEEYLQQYYLS